VIFEFDTKTHTHKHLCKELRKDSRIAYSYYPFGRYINVSYSL